MKDKDTDMFKETVWALLDNFTVENAPTPLLG